MTNLTWNSSNPLSSYTTPTNTPNPLLSFNNSTTMISIKTTTTLGIFLYVQFAAMAGSFASATPSRYQLAQLVRRADPENTVLVDSADKFWCGHTSFPLTNLFWFSEQHILVLLYPGLILRNSKPSGAIYFNFWLFCWINRDPHTNVGDSEHPGGMISYCSEAAKYSEQQVLASNFWSNVEYKTGQGVNGQSYVQRMFSFRFITLYHMIDGEHISYGMYPTGDVG